MMRVIYVYFNEERINFEIYKGRETEIDGKGWALFKNN